MTEFEDPLDAPVLSDKQPPLDGRLALQLHLLCFPLLIGLYYTSYWHTLTAAAFGMSLLLLVELSCTQPLYNPIWPNLQPLGYIGVLLLFTSFFFAILLGNWQTAQTLQPWGLGVLGLYFLLWLLKPVEQQTVPPLLRFAVGAVLIGFCWVVYGHFQGKDSHLWQLRAVFVAAFLVGWAVFAVFAIWWSPEQRLAWIDPPTRHRLPQLLHLVVAMGMVYYDYGDALLM
jgi:hypothetical protein